MYLYPWQDADRIEAYSDTDWAGCPRTRKSTNGGCIVLGRHLIKSWSTTQGLVALSSGEAEYYGVVRAAGTGLGYQSLLRDLGVELPLRAWTDSTATIGICGRSGLGKLRHIDIQALWLQQHIRSGALELRKVLGVENPADIFTKHLSNASGMETLLHAFGCVYRGGRPENAPELRQSTGTQAGTRLGTVTKGDGDRRGAATQLPSSSPKTARRSRQPRGRCLEAACWQAPGCEGPCAPIPGGGITVRGCTVLGGGRYYPPGGRTGMSGREG